jgi:hypothetical protein
MPSDKLDELFTMQQALNTRIGVNTGAMSEQERIDRLARHRCGAGQ